MVSFNNGKKNKNIQDSNIIIPTITSSNSSRVLKTARNIFEKKIEANKDNGFSSIPNTFKDATIDGNKLKIRRRRRLGTDETTRNLKGGDGIKRKFRNKQRSPSNRRRIQRVLSNQLQEVIQNLHAPRTIPTLKKVERTLSSQLQSVLSNLKGAVERTQSLNQHLNKNIDKIINDKCDLDKKIQTIGSIEASSINEEEEDIVLEKEEMIIKTTHKETIDDGDNDEDDDLSSSIEEMKRKIKEIQTRLDTIKDQTKNEIQQMKDEFTFKKKEFRQDLEITIAKEQQEKVRKNMATGFKLAIVKDFVAVQRARNQELRHRKDEMEWQIDQLKAQNMRLGREKKMIDEHIETLKTFCNKAVRDHARLIRTLKKCQTQYVPMYKETLMWERIYFESERRQKRIYKDGVVRIGTHMESWPCVGNSLQKEVARLICDCTTDLEYSIVDNVPVPVLPSRGKQKDDNDDDISTENSICNSDVCNDMEWSVLSDDDFDDDDDDDIDDDDDRDDDPRDHAYEPYPISDIASNE